MYLKKLLHPIVLKTKEQHFISRSSHSCEMSRPPKAFIFVLQFFFFLIREKNV